MKENMGKKQYEANHEVNYETNKTDHETTENMVYTDIRRFAEAVCKEVSIKMGEECEIKLQEVMKNNGVLLQGLVILEPGSSVSPTIYLEPLWELYISGTELNEITTRILEIYRRELPKKEVDMSFFREFPKVRPKICYKLINTKKNKTLLEQIPHVELLDLSLCFFYAYEDEQLGAGAILIRNSHMDMWNVTVEKLMKAAQENTSRLYPWELTDMGDLLGEYTGCMIDVPMKVLTNRRKVNGATCLIYPGVLARIAERIGENIYILPSSVHEVIIMPHSEVPDPERVQEIVREANATQLDPEEILSDSLYFYNFQDNRIDSITFSGKAT